jgi:hypothetical protein
MTNQWGGAEPNDDLVEMTRMVEGAFDCAFDMLVNAGVPRACIETGYGVSGFRYFARDGDIATARRRFRQIAEAAEGVEGPMN